AVLRAPLVAFDAARGSGQRDHSCSRTRSARSATGDRRSTQAVQDDVGIGEHLLSLGDLICASIVMPTSGIGEPRAELSRMRRELAVHECRSGARLLEDTSVGGTENSN